MRTSPHPRILIGFLLVGASLACNLLSAPGPNVETETPAATPSPMETATPVPPPTETVVPATLTPEYAPVCEPGVASYPTPAGCQIPIAEQSSVFCTNKNPYNLIFTNAGSTVEVLSEGFECSDAGIKDGRQMVTCTGPMATSFRVKVCDPACAIPTVQADITQCPQNYVYDNLLGCCTQELRPDDQNCVVLSLETRSCTVNCGVFTNKTTCEKNSYACEWNETNRACQLRK